MRGLLCGAAGAQQGEATEGDGAAPEVFQDVSPGFHLCIPFRLYINLLFSIYLPSGQFLKQSMGNFREKNNKNNPGTSALTPAMHAEFIKQLEKHAFVKAFGFQELLASDNVFSLMGLQGEDKYAFRDFPRENKLPFTKEQEQAIEVEITQALKQYGFYDRIMRAQMFE